jgi:DNA-binding LacI/PurR family transcriptional regulator
VPARPTMRDVAAAAGVSVMTVSRVLSGSTGVAPDTATRVEQAIADLGYRRNDIARHLRQKGQATRTIGLVVDDLGNPFYSALARAVEDAAYRRGYLVLVGSTNDDPRRERAVVEAFTARRIDGLILVPTSGSQRFLKTQLALGTPVVCADRVARGVAVDTVTVDNRSAARQAVSHLLEHGHHRVAYLGDQRQIWTLRERHAGYLDALGSAGVPVDPELVCHGLRSRRHAAQATARLLALARAAPTPLAHHQPSIHRAVRQQRPDHHGCAGRPGRGGRPGRAGRVRRLSPGGQAQPAGQRGQPGRRHHRGGRGPAALLPHRRADRPAAFGTPVDPLRPARLGRGPAVLSKPGYPA